MKQLWTIIKENLRDGEDIFILRQDELKEAIGIMHKLEFKDDVIGIRHTIWANGYKGTERVVRFWHEDGLCIILK